MKINLHNNIKDEIMFKKNIITTIWCQQRVGTVVESFPSGGGVREFT